MGNALSHKLDVGNGVPLRPITLILTILSLGLSQISVSADFKGILCEYVNVNRSCFSTVNRRTCFRRKSALLENVVCDLFL